MNLTKANYRINKAYDQLPEPRRFFTFMGVVAPGLILSSFPWLGLQLAGLGWLSVMIISRFHALRILSRKIGNQ